MMVTPGCASDAAQAPSPQTGSESARPKPWTAVFQRDDGTDTLPDLDGMSLVQVKVGSVLQLTGAHPEARISVGIPLKSQLEARSYSPVRFSLTYTKGSITCTGGKELSVTIRETEPISASYDGPVTCRSSDGLQNLAGRVSGVLNLRARKR